MFGNSIKYDAFDDTATSAMGEAFDHSCRLLGRIGTSVKVREMIAKRIVGAARNGEQNPIRLCEQALIPFGTEVMSTPVVSAGRNSPIVAYASVTRPAWPSALRPMQPSPHA